MCGETKKKKKKKAQKPVRFKVEKHQNVHLNSRGTNLSPNKMTLFPLKCNEKKCF